MPTAPRPHRPNRVAMPAAYDRFRLSSAKRGYDRKWSAYARSYLNDHPCCLRCGMPSQCVDHITPHSGQDDPLFWDDANHQALCNRCHSRKTAKYDGGLGNRRKGENHDRSSHHDT